MNAVIKDSTPLNRVLMKEFCFSHDRIEQQINDWFKEQGATIS